MNKKLKQAHKKEVESNHKFYKCSFWARYTAEITSNSTDTYTYVYSSVVAAWNADERDTCSNPLSILHFFLHFKSEGCWFESREQYMNNK